MAETTTKWSGVSRKTGQPMSFTTRNEVNQAVDTYSMVEVFGIADANSDKVLHIPEDMIITDIISDCATGAVRLYSGSSPTMIVVDYAAQQASSSGRPAWSIAIGALKSYKFKVEVILPA